MQTLAKLIAGIVRFWREESISVKDACIYSTLLATIALLLGSYIGTPTQSELQAQVQTANANARQFASEVARRNSELKTLRTKDHLNQKTIDILTRRIDTLYDQQIKKEEEVAFYQRIFSSRAQDEKVVVHGLEFSPSFAPQQWEINALFVRFDQRNAFAGTYYFDVIHTNSDGSDTITRHPFSPVAFEMNLYYEAQQTFHLSDNDSISNIRVTILDAEGNTITSKELFTSEDPNPDLPTTT